MKITFKFSRIIFSFLGLFSWFLGFRGIFSQFWGLFWIILRIVWCDNTHAVYSVNTWVVAAVTHCKPVEDKEHDVDVFPAGNLFTLATIFENLLVLPLTDWQEGEQWQQGSKSAREPSRWRRRSPPAQASEAPATKYISNHARVVLVFVTNYSHLLLVSQNLVVTELVSLTWGFWPPQLQLMGGKYLKESLIGLYHSSIDSLATT